MGKVKGTPLTVEIFNDEILPKIETKILEFKEEVIGEISSLREEVVVTLHQYKRTNDRVDKIDKHLDQYGYG